MSKDQPDWDAAYYAANTAHHRAFDEWFLAEMPLRDDLRLVDLGCGSGDFTRSLARLVPRGEVVGVDPQAEFVRLAGESAGPNQRFVVGRAQDLAAALGGERFDGVVSRAALQWAPCVDQPGIAAQVRASIVPGGFYRLEMGGAENIARVVSLLDDVSARLGGPPSPWCFPGAGHTMQLLEDAGFDLARGHVRTVAQRRPFTRRTLTSWLTSQVFLAYDPGLDTGRRQRLRQDAMDRLDELRHSDGSFDQIFVRLDVLAHVPGG